MCSLGIKLLNKLNLIYLLLDDCKYRLDDVKEMIETDLSEPIWSDNDRTFYRQPDGTYQMIIELPDIKKLPSIEV